MRADEQGLVVVQELIGSDTAVTTPVTVDVAAEIRKLESRSGKLDPRRVVEAARSPDSPLHAYFTWDDSAAAHRWRLSQAETLIRRCRTEITVEDVSVKVPVYVRDTTKEQEPGYRSLNAVKRSPNLSQSTFLYELRQAAGHLRRCVGVAEALGYDCPVDDLLEELEAIISKIGGG